MTVVSALKYIVDGKSDFHFVQLSQKSAIFAALLSCVAELHCDMYEY